MFLKENRQLPAAQIKVMRVLWDSPASLTSKQIIEKLQKEGGCEWNDSTIRTFLSRLVKRGFLAVANQGKEHYYAVIVDEQTYLKRATRGFLSQHYKDSMFCMVSTFADGRLTEEELQELRALMAKLEE